MVRVRVRLGPRIRVRIRPRSRVRIRPRSMVRLRLGLTIACAYHNPPPMH